MAVSRQMLKAMGIEDEKIDQIIVSHAETTDGLKKLADEYKEQAEKVPALEKKIEELSAIPNDSEGIRRDLAIADWNGRTVIIDDDVPVEEVAASGDKSAYSQYTTYLLGQGAFDYCDCGAKVPNETDRDPATNGGEEVLYTRQRKLFAPYGFSFVQPSTAIISPTDAQLKTGARWNIVKDAAGNGLFPHKAIPIVRIVSKG